MVPPGFLFFLPGMEPSRDGSGRLTRGRHRPGNEIRTRAARPRPTARGQADLHSLHSGPGGSVLVGAAVGLRELVRDRARAERLAPLIDTVRDLPLPERERSTLGSICSRNDPAGPIPPLMVALGARFHLTGPYGRRTLEAQDFFCPPFGAAARARRFARGAVDSPTAPAPSSVTALDPDELLVAVEIPARHGVVSVVDVHPHKGAAATARIALSLTRTSAGIQDVRLAAGIVAGSPLRLAAVERALLGVRDADEAVARAMGALYAEALDYVGLDAEATEHGRRLCARALERALRRSWADRG